MNAAIRAAGKIAMYKGMKVFGIQRGYLGMLNDEIFPMDSRFLAGIVDRGGTILLTARCEEFKEEKFRAIAAQNLKKRGIEGVVVIGGDGSYRGADALWKEQGIHVVGLPGTIDNDIKGTDYTIGFDTCLNTILDAMSKVRDTATSHERTILIEVMGRHAGDLALQACIAGGGDGVLIPEMEDPIELLAFQIKERRKRGKLHDIILVAEGVGRVDDIADQLKDRLTTEIRTVVLGHIQRGGVPSGFDRILAARMAEKAIDVLEREEGGLMIGIEGNRMATHPLSYAWDGERNYNIEGDHDLALLLAK
jgi:6-phosphofructokinase 1